MKIETHLSPNCSEATFTIVNWKKKKILDTFEMSSDSDCGGDSYFIQAIDGYAREKGVEIVETKNDGNGYHPDIIQEIKRHVKEGRTLNATQEEIEETLAKMDDNSRDDTTMIVAQFYMTNAELLKNGYIKKVKV